MQEHNEWLKFSNGDLRAASIMLKSEDDLVIGAVLYHCQQCIEKALKAYLAFKKRTIRKTHDLVELVNLCAEFDETFLTFLSDATELNPYATKARYPDSFFLMPDVSTARWAVQQTTIVFEFVENKIL